MLYSKSIFIREIISKYIYAKNDFKFLLSKKELGDLVISNLTNELKSKGLNSKVMWIYYSCVDNFDNQSNVIIDTRANQALYEYVISEPEFYLKNLIRPLYTWWLFWRA